MRTLSRRAEAIPESMTLAITAQAASLRAAGVDVIGFGVGEPDFPTPDHIVAAAVEAAADPSNHHYSPTAGLPELREAIAAKTTADSSRPTEADEVVVTNGAKHAVFAALSVVVDDGDEVLIPSPYWVTYPQATRLAGGRPVFVETGFESGFRVSVDQLEAARTEKTKALLFATPSNPTGIVYSAQEMQSIARWAEEHQVWVISDEIYDRLTYGDDFASAGSTLPDALLVNGVSKTYAMTGWRLGWLVAPPELTRAAARLQSHTTSHVNNVAQRAAVAALTGDQSSPAAMRQAFDRRRLAMLDLLQEMADVKVSEPTGAFYVFPYLGDRLTRPVAGRKVDSTLELASLLLDETQIAVVPGEPFGAPGYVRFSYALSDQELAEGMDRFASLLEA